MIRLAQLSDKPAITQIYKSAQKFMAENGNPTQWGTEYPYDDLILEDIKKKELYVIVEGGEIHGVFAFIMGEDPTYKNIHGAWIDDSFYGTIHRLASDGKAKGIFKKTLEFCKTKFTHIRIDTHENNSVMRKLILANGFTYCGKVYDEDRVRLAYEANFNK